MKNPGLHPLMIAGLVSRLVLIFMVLPAPLMDRFAPFLDISARSVAIDPWATWLTVGGEPGAFPYGYAMWLAFLPLTVLAKSVGWPVHYACSATLLAADFCLLWALKRIIPGQNQLLLAIYWLSPMVIVATYVLGFNDLLPALLLTLSMLFVRRVKPMFAGGFLAAAISANLTMVIALPFFLIYLYQKRFPRQRLQDFSVAFAACGLLFGLPFVLSNSTVQTLAASSEMASLAAPALDVDDGFSIYWAPLIYIVFLYFTWRIKRLNYDIFHVAMGIAFLLMGLLNPTVLCSLPRCVPFLCLYQALSGNVEVFLVALFSGLYVASALLVTPVRLLNGSTLDLASGLHLSAQLGAWFPSFLHTVMVAMGTILAVRIWREAVGGNDYFRLSRRPFVIGVAGDSGAGKDTYALAIAGMLGDQSVAKLSGDDYHLWDRQKPMWQVMTHLNPMANDLERFSNDLISLIDGKSVYLRHYDHQTGRMSKPTRSHGNDFIIASGLHALYLPIIRECCNLKIYLGIDERLRRHFKLQRDVHCRGHSLERVLASLDKREPDARRFIRPQAEHADLVFCLQPIHYRMLEDADTDNPVRLKLTATTRQGFNELALNRVLVGVCGLHVDILVSEDSTEVEMTIEGEASAADLALAAEILCPRTLEFLDAPPRWEDGMTGLMQLITLSHISQALTKRLI